jgi:dihydrofolate reductase
VTLSLIVAHDKNNGIGINGKLPWYIPADLRHFKKVTLGKNVIMGRKTWESLPSKPLVNRLNYVITSKDIPNIPTFRSVTQAVEYLKDSEVESIFIGGESIYRQVLPYCDKLYITKVGIEAKCDTYFPEVDFSKYDVIYSEISKVDVIPLTFTTYRRLE